MSEFLKFAYEVLSKIVYNLSEIGLGLYHLLITGWVDYFNIFLTYFPTLSFIGKVLSVLLMLILIGIPVAIIILIIRHISLKSKLRHDGEDNVVLYREIGRLNKQVLELIDEKNKILALKAGGVGNTPYVGASALLDEYGNIVDGAALTEEQMNAQAEAKAKAEEKERNVAVRFPKLSLVDEKYEGYEAPEFNNEITLEEFVDAYRRFACSKLHLYYTPEIIRRFVAGMASSHLLILEGISGTGKTSLPYSFSRFLGNPASLISVQPSYRDRTELLGYFNEFSKRFNETEFLRALYEADYRQDATLIVLDEMNLARIEYYFAEMLSVLEMPNVKEWVVELVPTAWAGDPKLMFDGKINVSPNTWFIGTANSDDSTFTITDKVYDRAMPIELNQRAAAFECEEQNEVYVTCDYLREMFEKAKEAHPISDEVMAKMVKMDNYLQTRFKLAFGNRIMKQMADFIPVYVACGGTELGALDYILSRKVLKKFESMNVSFVRDEIKNLITYMDRIFGDGMMPDCSEYLARIQNLY